MTVLYECGICSGLHPWEFTGECRDGENRYTDTDDYIERNFGPGSCVMGLVVKTMCDRRTADLGYDVHKDIPDDIKNGRCRFCGQEVT